ncbi:MAG: amino acid adenylation domain-containing protein [Ktedonobacteraceae bacterium]
MIQNIEDIYELSPLQSGILFHTLYAPDSGVYLVQFHSVLRGKLDIPLFRRAWQWAVSKNPVLRTAFLWEGFEKPFQVVFHSIELPWTVYDWHAISQGEQEKLLEKFLQEDGQRSFQLSSAPLLRISLIQVGEEHYHFIWSFHHIILDGWSHVLVINDVLAFYYTKGESALRASSPHPYKGYILWLQQQDLLEAEGFWRRILKDFTTPTKLGMGRNSNIHSQQKQYREQQILLPETMTVALQSFARQHRLTLNTVIQGAWALLLSYWSGECEVVFGTISSGRPPLLSGAETMVGLFINTLPMRVRVQSDTSLIPWLQKFQDQQVEMRQYEYCSLVQMHEWSDVPQGLPLFESLLIFENYPLKTSIQLGNAADFSIQSTSVREKVSYPLSVIVQPAKELALLIAYDGERFEDDMIDLLLKYLQMSLEEMLRTPEQGLSNLLFSAQRYQRRFLAEWNATQLAYPDECCIHQLFEVQVESTPDAIAVCFEQELLNYQELNKRANQLAHYLQQKGVGTGTLVGICLERSIMLVIALLAVHKVGGVYVPLDPEYPPERIHFMLQNARVKLVLTQNHLRSVLALTATSHLLLDQEWTSIAQQNTSHPYSVVSDSNLAYIIYTSGSTGSPKGVMISHRAIVNHMRWMQHTFPLTSEDRVLQKTPISFDPSVWEFYAPLLAGAQLIMARPEGHRDSTYLRQIIRQSSITHLKLVPATLHLLLQDEGLKSCQSLRHVFCEGESLPPNLIDAFHAQLDAHLYNLYGPTESTIDVLYWPCHRELRTHMVPIGRPIYNTQVYILDPLLQPVPIGVTGELYVAGAAVGIGYVNDGSLTAQKFLPDPFAGTPGTRMYQTGDLARYRPDGIIEYLGRTDRQVKIHGVRIELSEIEAVLCQHPLIQEAVVFAKEDGHGDKQLVACLMLEDSSGRADITLPNEFRSFLRQKLPSSMVPSTFSIFAVFPLLPSGKVDYKALLQTGESQRYGTYIPPQTDIEMAIVAIWQHVLHVEHVGLYDNFFDLGGHSLLAMQVYDRLREGLGKEFPLVVLFEYPTVSALAQYFSGQQDAHSSLESGRVHAMGRREAMKQQKQVGQARRAKRHQQGVRDE